MRARWRRIYTAQEIEPCGSTRVLIKMGAFLFGEALSFCSLDELLSLYQKTSFWIKVKCDFMSFVIILLQILFANYVKLFHRDSDIILAFHTQVATLFGHHV